MIRIVTLLLAAAALPAAAQSVCASDGLPRPVAVLERFINADCEDCWRDPATPKAKANELAIDWIVPGSKGDDAPLAMGASRDGLERLEALQRKLPEASDALRSPVAHGKHRLRVAHGSPINDYVGASIDFRPATAGPWQGWLLLVEALPAGAEGSPVARNLVRNVFRPSWDATKNATKFTESRPMQIHEGAKPSRLRVVGLVHDTRGRLVAAVQSDCK